jgi:nucleoside phosphorylase
MNRNEFFILFGVDPGEIKKVCIMAPFVSKEVTDAFAIGEVKKGSLYAVGSNENFSLIVTRMGAAFTGDAVLYLKMTGCRKAILFGACAGTQPSGIFNIGSTVMVKKAFAQDSFVSMIMKRAPQGIFYPDAALYKEIASINSLAQATCLSVGSLQLESEYLKSIEEKDVQVVDMETASFLAAAEHVSIPAAAVLFITDIIEHSPYYLQDRETIRKITSRAARLVGDIALEIAA